jgi:uric acid-xanthine permease
MVINRFTEYWFRPESGIFRLCPTIFAPRPLPWGSPEFIGLGFLSFITILLVELFGSPFLKNASIIIGLIVGCIVAGATGYIDGSSIKGAPAITFLWVRTFKIRIHPPAILPMLAVYSMSFSQYHYILDVNLIGARSFARNGSHR